MERGGGTKKPKDGDICIDLVIQNMPTKTEYMVGEKFNPAGLVFDAVYENGFDGDTGLIGADLDGYLPRTPLTESDTTITLLFEGFQKEIPITVIPKTLLDMRITRDPDIRSYYVGDVLDLGGLAVRAEYEEGVVENETNFTVTDKNGKEYKNGDILEDAVGDLDLTVTVKAGEVVKTDMFSVSVYRGMTVQAEDYVEADADEKPTDRSFTVLTGNEVKNLVKNTETWTGWGYIGSIARGVVIEFNIYTAEPIENADLVLIASSTRVGEGKMDDMQFNKFCRVSVDYNDGNGYTDIAIPDYVVIEGKEFPAAGSGGSKWTNWADVPFGTIDLPSGFTKVRIECTGTIKDIEGHDRTPNVDRLDVRSRDADANVTHGDLCTNIEIKQYPSKMSYKEGETFDPTGIVFDAEYLNGYDGDVDLGASDLKSFSPSGPLSSGDTEISLTYKTFVKKIKITLAGKNVASLAIEREPDTVAYSKGGQLNLYGMIVKATYEDGSTATVTDYTVKDASGKVYTSGTVLDTAGDITLIVEYSSGETKASASFTVTVAEGVTVQAEAVLNDGETTPTDRSYTVFTAGKANITDKHGSGGGSIENVAVGTKVEFYVYSNVAMTGADVIFTLASTNNDNSGYMRDMRFNKLFKVYVGDNNDELYVGDGVVIEGKEVPANVSRWFLWSDVNVGKVDLTAGFTKITLECIGQIHCADGSDRAANIDCLNVRVSELPDVRGKQIVSVEASGVKTSYLAGDKLDLDELSVKATYEGGIVIENERNYKVVDGTGKELLTGDTLAENAEVYIEVSNGSHSKRVLLASVRETRYISVEAENITASGVTPPEDGSYVTASGTYNIEDAVSASGGKGVTGLETNAQLNFFVYSDSAIENAVLIFTASSLDRDTGNKLTKDTQFNKIFELYIDGEKVTIGDDVLIKGRKANDGEKLWFLYADNELTSISLKQGFTQITFNVIGKIKDSADGSLRSANIDKITVKY